jgi:hypothetical protein
VCHQVPLEWGEVPLEWGEVPLEWGEVPLECDEAHRNEVGPHARGALGSIIQR